MRILTHGSLLLVLLSLLLAPAASDPRTLHEPAAAPGQSATLLPDGRWLLAGGERRTRVLKDAALWDPLTQTTTPLTQTLNAGRAGHSATVLPDGSVLIVGGIGVDRRALGSAERFDPATGAFETIPTPGLRPRAFHTATLLTDGRVLLAGGLSGTGAVVVEADLWDPGADSVDVTPLVTPRHRHQATLLPDGAVVLWGGRDGAGVVLDTGELYQPHRADFSAVGHRPDGVEPSPGPPGLAASLPAHGAEAVSTEAMLVLRFSKPLRVNTVNPETVTLIGPAGLEDATIVPAEGGRLAFVTPHVTLTAGATYTLSVNGPADNAGFLLPPTAITFTTERTTVGPHGAEGASHTASAQAPVSSPTSQVIEVDEGDWMGERRKGRPYSPWQTLPPLAAADGVTALAGQVLRLNGQPLADVTLRIDSRSARTDATGRFLLSGIDAGAQELLMDGQTASRPGRTYATFQVGIAVEAGRTNVLSFTIWLPTIDTRHATPVPVPTPRELVATTPRIPGLEMHIPANVVLRGHAGPLTSLTLTEIPVDRPPFPLPEGAYFLFTPQTHGARVERPDGRPSPVGVRFVLPNRGGLAPGSRVDLAGYDARRGWYVYGQGSVTRDGRQIMPDPGVEFDRVTCVHPLGGGAPAVSPPIGGKRDGDPVDLATGLFVLEKTDLVIPDAIPIVIKRTYRPGDWTSRPFGRGASFLYEMYLAGEQASYSYADLILADGGKIRYHRTSPGTDYWDAVMEHTSTPSTFYRSVLRWNPALPGWDLTLRDGTLYQFEAWAGGLLVGIRDRVGNRLAITRDRERNQRITQITSPNGRWVVFSYGSAIWPTLVTQVRDNAGRVVTYTYDETGVNLNLVRVTDPAGGVTEYSYAPDTSRMLTLKDARGIVFLINEYDGAERVIRQTQADGTTYQFAYTLDANGRIVQTDVTDPGGHVRRVTFNADGYALTDTRALGTPVEQPTTYHRQPGTNLVNAITDALGRRTEFTYDAMGNRTSTTRLSGTPHPVTTRFTYDPTFNQMTSVTDPLDHTTTFAYDGAGNLTRVTDPLGHQTTVVSNAVGQPVAITTPAGTTTLTYDLGDLAAVTRPTGQTTTRFTDGAGRVLASTDPLGQRTAYDYDTLNRLTRVTDALGGMTRFEYDANGNLITQVDARGSVTRYGFDAMDRVVMRTDPVLRAESYSYDGAGNLTVFVDRQGQATNSTYDALRRVSLVTHADASTTSYSWDAGNRLTRIVDSIAGTITRVYDGLDRLIRETTPQGTVNYTYDAASRRASMAVAGQPTIAYTYDIAARLTQITQGATTVSFGYDTANRRSSLMLGSGVATEYVFDAASRLAGLTYRNGTSVLGTLTYDYDAADRRTRLGGTWARTALPRAVAATTYDAADRQLTFDGQALTYDLNGNLTSDGATTYTWDVRNRLVALSGPGATASFTYDPLGRRIRRQISGTITDFVYDGVNPVQELSGSGVVNLLTGLAVDEYFARTDSTDTRTLLADGLGSTLALVDSSGAVRTEFTYEPFGNTSSTGSASSNALQYSGRENDGTGLYYYRARYYSPALHRFLSEDLVSEIGTNRYGYVRNTPLNAVDPYGLLTVMIHGGSGSLGPNGWSDLNGNPGLNMLQAELEQSGELVVRLNSSQLGEAVRRAEQACRAREPLHIVGHSMGGTAAIETAFQLYRLGWLPNNLITIDPFSPRQTMIPPGITTTNFVQRQGWPFGEYLSGRSVNPHADQLVTGLGDDPHGTITDRVHTRAKHLILGTRKSCAQR